MAHAKLFTASGSARWMPCPGAPALERHYPNSSSKWADQGTAAHTLGSDCLTNNVDAEYYRGRIIKVESDEGGVLSSREFEVDDEMILNVQIYLDLVRSYVAMGYTLLVEQRVSYAQAMELGDDEAEDEGFGTSDTILISPDGNHVIIIDLKYGQGVKVYAEENTQMLTYALGTVETFDYLGSFEKVTVIVCQPRIDHIDVWNTTLERVKQHAQEMKDAAGLVKKAIARNNAGEPIKAYLNPGEKQCNFCKAAAGCPALTAQVAQSVFDDFDALNDPHAVLLGAPPKLPDAHALGAKLAALDLIETWVKAVYAEGERLIYGGVEVIGPDNLPMKVVEGKKGNRKWKDEKIAEGLLVGALEPSKAYKPREIITPSVADKLLNKKKTRETWVQFMDQIEQSEGKPKIALGSDSRPAFKPNVATIDDFVDLSDPAE